MTDAARRLEKLLVSRRQGDLRALRAAAPGDRIMVAMSGGKDSYTLFHLLTRLVPRLPFAVELSRCTSIRSSPATTATACARTSRRRGQPFEILREDTYSVVTVAPRRHGDLLLAVLAPAPRHPLHRRRAARLQQDRARPPPRRLARDVPAEPVLQRQAAGDAGELPHRRRPLRGDPPADRVRRGRHRRVRRASWRSRSSRATCAARRTASSATR